MRRFIKRFIKVLIVLAVVLCIAWFGLKFYFTDVNRIAERVRSDVLTQIKAERSRFLAYNDIPEMYRNAVIATEDRSFFTNIGINFEGIGRALFVDIWKGGPLQGGSTITQQLVHNTLLRGIPKSLSWKVLESLYAIGLYDTMDKKETFVLYSNDIYFGQGAYGVYDAAQTYFGKVPSQLNAGELTMLAGIPNAPSDYDPIHNMTLARERQKVVLVNMVEAGVVTQAEADQIFNEPIRLRH